MTFRRAIAVLASAALAHLGASEANRVCAMAGERETTTTQAYPSAHVDHAQHARSDADADNNEDAAQHHASACTAPGTCSTLMARVAGVSAEGARVPAALAPFAIVMPFASRAFGPEPPPPKA